MPYLERGIFIRFDPTVPPVPILVDVSRSGREYPAEFRSPVSFTTLHDNVSMYVDDLWADAPDFGATLLFAQFPSFWIDANRDELDIDPELIAGEWPVPLRPSRSKTGLGLLKSKSRYGEPVHERKLTVAEVQERLEKYHRPYFRELGSNIERLKSSFGFVYQFSCHCMSAVGAPTHPDPGQDRPDFCVGNLRGKTSSQAFLESAADTIRSLGFSCTINHPYVGGELIGRFGAPDAGVESIMVEINKKLFMDTTTFRKTDGFPKVKAGVSAFLKTFADRARERIAQG